MGVAKGITRNTFYVLASQVLQKGTSWSGALPYLRLFLVLGLTLAAAYLLRAFVPWVVLAVVVAALYVCLLYAFKTIAQDEWRFLVGLMGRSLGLRRGAA